MIENQYVSKRERMDIQQPSGDLLSELPLSIIHIILARIPLKDAIRTSVLSRQWRNTWASLPYLVFDDECVSYSETDESIETRLCHFITQALYHHKGPIHKCKMFAFSKSKSPGIDEWILCLSNKDIKEITLYTGGYGDDEIGQVPSSIYSCEKLTHLELGGYDLDPPPSTFKGFLFLRCLILLGSFMSPNAIESLVANSPLLERFTLWNASCNRVLRFSAPNLKYLDLSGDYKELCVYAPLLVHMYVSLRSDNSTTYQQQKSLVCNYANFMAGFTNLEKLSGCEYFIKYWSMGIESCHHTVVFHQLKDVDLFVNFRDIKAIKALARLIAGAPNLEKLKINTGCYDDDSESEENDESEGDDEPEAQHLLSFRDFGCGPNFTFEKLRVFILSTITDHPLEMEFIIFLLESSPALETMELGHFVDSSRIKDRLKLTVELLGFCRASSKAKISWRGNYLYPFSL